MGTSYNPKIVTDGLVLNLDPANVKSYPAGQDSYANNVSLLLDGESLTDKSQNNFTVTNSSVAVSSAEVKYGTSSLYFNGASYLSIPDSSAFSFGAGDFTLEAWVLVTSSITSGTYRSICCKYSAGSTGTEDAFQFLINNNAGTMQVTTTLVSGTTETAYSFNITGVDTLLNSTWNHIALTRSAGSIRCFFNGTQIGTTQTYSSSVNQGTLPLLVGARTYAPLDLYFNGYIDDLRITKAARYTANFTPSTGPLSLPGVITDLTKNKNVGTFIGGPTYNASNGGSVVLAGSTALDYITIPDSELWTLSSTDFSIFIWANLSTLTQVPSNRANSWPQAAFISQNPGVGLQNKWIFSYDTYVNQMVFHANSTSGGGPEIRTGTVTISANQWYSFGITRIGTTYTFYLNGVSVGSSVSSYTIPNSTAALNIGYGEITSSLSAKISNVLFYRKGLTSNEVLQNYNATKGRFA